MNKTVSKISFDPTSPGFVTTLLSALFAIAASIGIDFGSTPDQISNDLFGLFTSGGFAALVGYVIVNVLGPVWNFVKKKQPVNWRNVLGSTTTIVSLAGVVIAALVYFWGISIPASTPTDAVGAIAAKNWGLLISLAIANVIIPIARWFKDRKKVV